MTLEEALAVDFRDQSARALWLALFVLAKGADRCSVSVADIALHTRMAERKIRRAMIELERLKLTEISRGNGRGIETSFRLKVAKMTKKGGQGFSKEINDMDKTFPYRDDGQRQNGHLSEKTRDIRQVTTRLKVVLRRKVVRDAYLTFLSMLDDAQFVTASALAKELGMSCTTVRNDLMALFRSLDIPLEAQFRYRKSQRKPWHAGKMGGTVIPFYDRGRR